MNLTGQEIIEIILTIGLVVYLCMMAYGQYVKRDN